MAKIFGIGEEAMELNFTSMYQNTLKRGKIRAFI